MANEQAYNDYVANQAVAKLQSPKTAYRWLHELPKPNPGQVA